MRRWNRVDEIISFEIQSDVASGVILYLIPLDGGMGEKLYNKIRKPLPVHDRVDVLAIK
jgi:hypothetical protein